VGSVRVPETVSAGKAKITLSVKDWKEKKVVPSSVEVPIRAPKPAEK
jgi:hypothetical protein